MNPLSLVTNGLISSGGLIVEPPDYDSTMGINHDTEKVKYITEVTLPTPTQDTGVYSSLEATHSNGGSTFGATLG